MIARFQTPNVEPAFDYVTAALVTQCTGKATSKSLPDGGGGVGMTDASGDYFQQNFAFLRSVHVDFFDRQDFCDSQATAAWVFMDSSPARVRYFFRTAVFSDDRSGFYKILPGLYSPAEPLNL